MRAARVMRTMRAIRIRPAPAASPSYSAENPAPSSALQLVNDIPKPQVSQPGELVVRIKATTVIRDCLTWPEVYADPPALLGNDFSGIVAEVHDDDQQFRPGDEVYGMTSAHRGGTWAEYALAKSEEVYAKPGNLSWEEAAALPLSALTADQALFDHAGLEIGTDTGKRVLVDGAAGGVGMFVVQFAAAAGHYVVAATSSNARNRAFLLSLGAKETVEYKELHSLGTFDAIVDTVGGDVLCDCWNVVKPDGALISVDSASWNFVLEHKDKGLSKGKENVRALFFIVEPSSNSMRRISNAVATKGVKGLVSKIMALDEAREAYDLCHSRKVGPGKLVLVP